MKRLVLFELRKIWYRRWAMAAVVPVFILLFWLITMNWDPIRIHLDGRYRWMTEEFQPYWGVAITEDFRAFVRAKAEPYGITDDEFFLFDSFDLRQRYGENSREYWTAEAWETLYLQPPFDENLFEEDHYTIENGIIRSNFPVWQVHPEYTVWTWALDGQMNSTMLTGICTLGLILVMLSNLYGQEDAGGLGDISMSTKGRRQWMGAKVLAAYITGAGIAGGLYLAVVALQGAFLSFRGWNLDAVSYLFEGSVTWLLPRPCTALELMLIKLFALILSGGFFGVLTAAASSWLRQVLPTAGIVMGASALMQSLHFLAYDKGMYGMLYGLLGEQGHYVEKVFTATPLRMFLNVEQFALQFFSWDVDPMNSTIAWILEDPPLCMLYLGLMLLGTGICSMVCLASARNRRILLLRR